MPITSDSANSGTNRMPAEIAVPRPGVTLVEPSSTPTAFGLLKALRRRWPSAAMFAVLAAAVTGTAAWSFVPAAKNEAYAKLYMPSKPEGVLYAHPEGGAESPSYHQTQAALIKSRFVLVAALNSPELVKLGLKDTLNAVEWLEKEIKITVPDGPELPRVSLSGPDPERLRVIIHAVIDAYMNEIVNKETAHRRERLEQLERIAADYGKRLKRLQEQRNALARAAGSGDKTVLALKQEMAQKELTTAQSDLIKVDADLRRMELELRTRRARSDLPFDVPDKLVDAQVEKDLDEEVMKLTLAETRLRETRRVLNNESHPKMVQLREDIELQQQAVQVRRQELRPLRKTQLIEKAKLDHAAQITLLEEQIKFQKEYRVVLAAEIERLEKKGQVLNVNAIDMDNFHIELTQAEASVTRVMAEIDKQTVELPAPPRVTCLEEGVVIAPPDSSRKMKLAGMGAFGAFGSVLLLVSLMEFRARRVDSPAEVVEGLGLPLLGSVPAVSKRVAGQWLQPASGGPAVRPPQVGEAVDAIRTLLLGNLAEGMRVVMVASAVGGEGKTSLATHLAVSLAQAGRRTLLLDGDLREPTAHRVFGLAGRPGLCDVLRGSVPSDEAIRPTTVPGLSLLPAGRFDQQMVPFLAREPIHDLLRQLRSEYDAVVVDSAPLLAVADSLLLAQQVDGIILSLFHEVSRLPFVFAAHQRLALLGARMLGVVMTGAPDEMGTGDYPQRS